MNPPCNRKSAAGNPPPTARAPVLDPTNSSLRVDFQGARVTSDSAFSHHEYPEERSEQGVPVFTRASSHHDSKKLL